MLIVGLATPVPAAIITAAPHPDAGYILLKNGDGKNLSLNQDTPPQFSWTDNAGAWERFQDGGNMWVAVRDNGTWAIVKGSTL